MLNESSLYLLDGNAVGRLDQMEYTGIPISTMINPGQVYCGL